MKFHYICPLFLVVILTGYSSVGLAGDGYQQTSNKITLAYFNFDEKALAEYAASKSFISQIDAEWRLYSKALIKYRLAVISLYHSKDQQADQYLDAALEFIALDESDRTLTERLGLKSSLYGLKIAVSAFRGMSLGRKIGDTIDEAKKRDKSNLRIKLFDAVSLYNKPFLFGGDKEKAINLLEELLQSPNISTPPYWGLDDAKHWYVRMILGKFEGARAARAIKIFESLKRDYPNSPLIAKLQPKVDSAIETLAR
ncbi:MAG: tetratricopeptide repeat protein [Paraglaciecola sp.]|nr:tetratricopeptide repeat protein [Paraglaciecola sp.]